MAEFENRESMDEAKQTVQDAASVANNAARQLKNVPQQTANAVKNTKKAIKNAKKAAKHIKRAAKLTGEAVKYLATALKAIGSFIVANFPTVVCIIAAVAMCAGILSIFANVNYNSYAVRLSQEARNIIAMFDSYFLDASYRLDGSVSIADVDGDFSKYQKAYNYIKRNNYEYVLCAYWNVVVQNELSVAQFELMDEDTRRFMNLDDSGDVYERIINFYCEKADDGGYIYGFYSALPERDYQGMQFHQYYTRHCMKACIDAFINSDGSYIEDLDTLKSTAPADSNETTTVPSQSEKGSIEDYSERLTELTINNFFENSDNNKGVARPFFINTENNGGSRVPIKAYLNLFNKNRGIILESDTETARDQKIKNDLINKIKRTASGYLSGNSSADGVARLAHAQLGNDGTLYCNEVFGQMADWCAIYACWLIENGGGVKRGEFYWSAGCETWKNNMHAQGLFYSAAEQQAGYFSVRVGDVVFLDDLNHVGVVIEITENGFMTSEGNTKSNNYMTSEVSEYEYSFSSDRIYGYGRINYPVVSELLSDGVNGIKTSGQVDPNYCSISFREYAGRDLTSQERTELERIITGEFGSSYEGSLLIAQCLRDALVYGYCDNVMSLRSKMGYDGYSYDISDNAKDAVRKIFDNGEMAVQHRILVMYATNICESPWHEEQNFIVSCDKVRFFDYW